MSSGLYLCKCLCIAYRLVKQEGTVTNSIGSLSSPDFPISAHGHSNAYTSFLLLFTTLLGKKKKNCLLLLAVDLTSWSQIALNGIVRANFIILMKWTRMQTLKIWTIISNLKFEIENEIDENINTENMDNFKCQICQ